MKNLPAISPFLFTNVPSTTDWVYSSDSKLITMFDCSLIGKEVVANCSWVPY